MAEEVAESVPGTSRGLRAVEAVMMGGGVVLSYPSYAPELDTEVDIDTALAASP